MASGISRDPDHDPRGDHPDPAGPTGPGGNRAAGYGQKVLPHVPKTYVTDGPANMPEKV